MKTLPLDIGVLHFVGIGGIGMSGIAETLHELGYQVRGSDIAESANVARLRDAGIAVSIGHRAENVDGTAVVVVSTAIDTSNPEVAAARAQRIPVVRRAEMLAELMRLKWSVAVGGTHGKTTTTSMVAAVLDAGGIDPTVINGGIINAYGTNARLGDGDWMVVEADESDGTFIKLPATIAVVTNIDPEHLDFYGDFDAVRDAFATFVSNIPFYGFAAMCIDHPEVQAMIPRFSDRRIVSYGLSPQAEVRGVNVTMAPDGARFDVELARRDRAPETRAPETRAPETITGLRLPMLGRHNVLNALAAIAVGLEMGLETAAIARGLANFGGVKRRFTQVGEAGGISVIDDYGHHPVEISAVLQAAREGCQGRVFAVFQPHRFSRVASLFEEFCTCFNDADVAIVTDIYPAGESPMEGVDRGALVAGLQAHGHRDARSLPTTYGAGAPSPVGDLAAMIADAAQPGDMVVCLGAGNITAWAQELPAALALRLNLATGT